MTIDHISSKLADEGIRQGELAFATRVGREEGFEAGLEQGLEQGLEKGREKNSLQIIQQMLVQKMSWDLITQLTRYDLEGYERLRAKY